MIGVSPSGKATVFDTVIRWFESSHPSHKFLDGLILQTLRAYETKQSQSSK